jgi:hypothetical protein
VRSLFSEGVQAHFGCLQIIEVSGNPVQLAPQDLFVWHGTSVAAQGALGMANAAPCPKLGLDKWTAELSRHSTTNILLIAVNGEPRFG